MTPSSEAVKAFIKSHAFQRRWLCSRIASKNGLGYLAQRCKFGKCYFDGEHVSAEWRRCRRRTEIKVRAESYMHKVKPLTTEKGRLAHPEGLCMPKDTIMLRGLNGSVQWPASQSMLHLSATASLSQANRETVAVQDLLGASIALRLFHQAQLGHGPPFLPGGMVVRSPFQSLFGRFLGYEAHRIVERSVLGVRHRRQARR